jgi:hypothetical protein
MVTILVIFFIGSFLAALLVIAPGMVSSRLGESEMMVEEYEPVVVQPSSRKFSSWAQSAEVNA